MKNLYIISGTMGVGKSTICQHLKKNLNNSVFLDGDWCWDSNPDIVNDETKNMVNQNICYLLNNFIRCSCYENIIFCWVMHNQEIIDNILNNINISNCQIKSISLMANAKTTRKRLERDILMGIRKEDVIAKSLERISLYKDLNTIKIHTDNKTVDEIVNEIKKL